MTRIVNLSLGSLALAFSAPFLLSFAGDSQVHLAVAEQFAAGRPFQYNPGGELVAASTSPFWTLLLASFFLIAGSFAPLLLKFVTVLLWVVAGVLLYRIAKDVWGFTGAYLYALVGSWLTSALLISNALSGLENVLSAVQLLLLYSVAMQPARGASARASATLGLLLGWTILTRVDAGLFGAAIVLLYFARQWLEPGARVPRNLILPIGLMLIACGLVLVPWYIYQYQMTGRLVADSALARMFLGRRYSLAIVPGWLYFHPKALATIATVFFPLFAGWLVLMWRVAGDARGSLRGAFAVSFPQIVAAMVVAAGIAFYSFVVGATHFGRYFLPLFPFLFLCGFGGLKILREELEKKSARAARFAIALMILAGAVLFLCAGSALNWWRQVVNGYNFSYNLAETLAAPAQRKTTTDRLWQELGVSLATSVNIAIGEVQLRYFVDERVTVTSLDGRSSATFLRYVDPTTGALDFERYLADEKPDLVVTVPYSGERLWDGIPFLDMPAPAAQENSFWRQVRQVSRDQPMNWNGHKIEYVSPCPPTWQSLRFCAGENIVRIHW